MGETIIRLLKEILPTEGRGGTRGIHRILSQLFSHIDNIVVWKEKNSGEFKRYLLSEFDEFLDIISRQPAKISILKLEQLFKLISYSPLQQNTAPSTSTLNILFHSRVYVKKKNIPLAETGNLFLNKFFTPSLHDGFSVFLNSLFPDDTLPAALKKLGKAVSHVETSDFVNNKQWYFLGKKIRNVRELFSVYLKTIDELATQYDPSFSLMVFESFHLKNEELPWNFSRTLLNKGLLNPIKLMHYGAASITITYNDFFTRFSRIDERPIFFQVTNEFLLNEISIIHDNLLDKEWVSANGVNIVYARELLDGYWFRTIIERYHNYYELFNEDITTRMLVYLYSKYSKREISAGIKFVDQNLPYTNRRPDVLILSNSLVNFWGEVKRIDSDALTDYPQRLKDILRVIIGHLTGIKTELWFVWTTTRQHPILNQETIFTYRLRVAFPGVKDPSLTVPKMLDILEKLAKDKGITLEHIIPVLNDLRGKKPEMIKNIYSGFNQLIDLATNLGEKPHLGVIGAEFQGSDIDFILLTDPSQMAGTSYKKINNFAETLLPWRKISNPVYVYAFDPDLVRIKDADLFWDSFEKLLELLLQES